MLPWQTREQMKESVKRRQMRAHDLRRAKKKAEARRAAVEAAKAEMERGSAQQPR